eukprot:GHVP01027989.1.p1 GENE.GHVP01027989.1~~GHVP01027989.1.p1  ORF type:complete len:531 (+),score=62.79 GHVP01027989.1:1166-2758(+)
MMFVIYVLLLLLKIRTESRCIDITSDILLPLKNNMDLFEDENSKDKNDDINISKLMKEGFDVIESIKNDDKDTEGTGNASSRGASKDTGTNKEPSKTTHKEPSKTINKITNEKEDAIILFSFGVKYTYLTLTAIYQLKMVKTKARVVVVVDEETYVNNRDIMDLYIYIGVYDIEVIPQTFIDSIKPGYVTSNGKERDSILWKKIYVFNMIQYNSVLMLDTDTLIKDNFDEVFDLIGKDTLYVNKTTHEVSNEMMDDCIIYKCNKNSEILSIAISDANEKICLYEPLAIVHKEIDSTSSKEQDLGKENTNSKETDIGKDSSGRDMSKDSISKDKDDKNSKERGHETSKLSKSNNTPNKTNGQADVTEEWFNKAKLTVFAKNEDKVNSKIGMNIGFALIRPNREMLQDMISLIGRMKFRTCCPVQEFLYRYFESRGSYLRLPQIYNARRLKKIKNNETKKIVYNYAKIYHFVEKNKLEALQNLNNKFSICYSRISKQMDKELDEWPYEGYKDVINKIRSSWLGLNDENIREF